MFREQRQTQAMSDDGEKKPRRRRLSGSRKLGGRRRRGRKKEEEAPPEEEAAADEAPAEADAGAAPEALVAPEPADQTVAVTKLPSPEGSGSPELNATPAPPAGERWAKVKGGFRRFGTDFSKYLVGLGQSAHQSGVDFNQNVVKPFSHALFEAAICIALLFIAGAGGVMFGGYLKTVSAQGANTVSFQNREIRPGQQIDESFFSQGFDTAELHRRANRVLDDHLSALRRSEFVEAYELLSPAWKDQLSYRTFEQGYLSTQVLAYEIGKVETLDPRKIRLRAELKVKEQGSDRIYSAVYIAVLTRDGWRLDGGTFQ